MSAGSITLLQDSTAAAAHVGPFPNDFFALQEIFTLPDGGTVSQPHNAYQLGGGAEAGAWHHVVITLTVEDGMQHYSSGLTVDDQVIEQNRPLELPWVQGTASVIIGVTYAVDPGSQLFYDNVRADLVVPAP